MTKSVLGGMSGTAIRRIILQDGFVNCPSRSRSRSKISIVSEIEKHFTRIDAAVANVKRANAKLKAIGRGARRQRARGLWF